MSFPDRKNSVRMTEATGVCKEMFSLLIFIMRYINNIYLFDSITKLQRK